MQKGFPLLPVSSIPDMESSQHHSPQNMIFQDSKEVPYRMAKMSEYSLLSNDSSTMTNSSSEPGPSFLLSPLERVKQFNLSQAIVTSGRLLGSLNALLSQTNISFSSVANNISSFASSLSHTTNLSEIIRNETSQLLFFPIHSFLSYSKEAYDQHHNLSFRSINSSTLLSFSTHPLVNDLFSKVSNLSQSMNDSLPLVVEVTKEFANKTKEVLSTINEEYLPEVNIIWPWEKKMKRLQELKRKSMEERETAETLDDLFHSENDDEYEKDDYKTDEESSLKDKSSLESPSSSSSVFQQLLTLFQKFGSNGDHNSSSSQVSTDQAKSVVGNDSPNNKSVNVTGSTAIDGVNASMVVGDTEESKEESSVFYRFLRLFPSASEVFHGTSNSSRSSHATHTQNTTDRHIELRQSNTQALRQLAEPSHLTKIEVSEVSDNKVVNTGEAEEESFLSFLLSSLTNSTNLSSLFWSSSENISIIDANSLFVNSSYHHLSSFTSYPLFLAIQTSLQVKTTFQYHEYMNVIGIQPLFDAIFLLKKNKQYNNENNKKQGKENSGDVVLSSSSSTTPSSPSAHLEINSYEAIKGLIHLLSFDMNIANQIIENKDIIEVLCNEIAKIVNEESNNSFLKKLKLSSSPTSTVLKEKEKQFQNLYNILSLFYEMIRLVSEDHCYLLQSNHKLTKALKILRENPVFSTFPVVSPPPTNNNNNSNSGSTVNVTVISKKEDSKEVKGDDDYSSFSFMIDSSQPLKMNQISNILHCGLGNTEWKPRVPGQKGIRILALDGGGTRGVVSLTYIKEIMKRIKRPPSSVSTASSSSSSIFSFLSSSTSSSSSSIKSKQDSSDPSNDDDTSSDEVRPYELFDMICGTSTGGIIALLLSGYSSTITISQCELLYDRFIKDIFSKKSSFNLLKKKAFYDETLFEKILNSLCGNSIFLDINKNLLAPRVFCLSTKCNSIPPSPQIWRNYNYPMIQEGEERKKSRNPGSSRISLSTAIRATTAAPTFFTPVPYEDGLYCDGALVANNPAAIAIEEAKVRKIAGLFLSFFFYSSCLVFVVFLVFSFSYFTRMFQ
jgi:hypothetical protein